MVKIDTQGLIFYSQLDETALFNWASEIECIASVDRGIFHIDETKVNQGSLRDLISLLFRYNLPMEQLSTLLNNENKSWFKNPNAYWHQKVFGDKNNNIIKNGKTVESMFGCWPKFTDGNITKLSVDSAKNTLRISIYYVDSENNKSAEIGLLFCKIKSMELNEIYENNVLDELVVEKSNSGKDEYDIKLVGGCGATGQFICKSLEVEYINA